MAIVKPYTFQGGTKARAQEVNENFDRLYAQVNINSSNIEDINVDIASIEEDKANVNGDATQAFNVKDPTSSYNAANKNYVDSTIASSLSSSVTTNTTQTITGSKTFTGTIKVPNSATVGTAIATQAISKSGNGYLKMGNGVIIQWGRSSAVGYDEGVTVTLPAPFSNANYRVIPVCYNTSYQDNIQYHIYYQSSSQFRAFGHRVESKNSGTRYLQWVAIGY